MLFRLVIEPEADQELEAAALWYGEQQSGLGGRFLSSVAKTLERIQRFPEAGSLLPYLPRDLPVRRAPVKAFPFHVVYLIDDPGALKVLAFVHESRRPGYWLRRYRD
ncbi:MAG: type II toxin-antitoxin system RelE/ParE family toxin [Acidobacteria bacterium]|nr:type II toxin-antitoxin system RelE/ParE family toxin [Acidobacteriota bacterium]